MAGDKCIPGEERSFFSLEVNCLLGIPQDFDLSVNVTAALPNEAVHFTLTQQQVRGGACVGGHCDEVMSSCREPS